MTKYIIITEANDEGVIDIGRLNTENQAIFAFELKKFFLKKDEYLQDYINNDNFDLSTASDKDVILFFKNKIEESFVDGDSYSRYQVFNEELKEIEITID